MDAAKVAAEEAETAQLELELEEFSKAVDQINNEFAEDKSAQRFIQDVQSGKITADKLDDLKQQKIKKSLDKFSPLEGKYEQLKNDLVSADPALQKKFEEIEKNYQQIYNNIAPLKALIQRDQTVNKKIESTKAAAERATQKQPETKPQNAPDNQPGKPQAADKTQPAGQPQTSQPPTDNPAVQASQPENPTQSAAEKTGLFSGIWSGFKNILGQGKDAVKGFFKFIFKDLPRAIFTGKTEE